MHKSLATALLCACASAISTETKTKAKSAKKDDEGIYNIQDVDWSNYCILDWTKDQIDDQFNTIDSDGSGTLTSEEVTKWLKNMFEQKSARKFFKSASTRALDLMDTDNSKDLSLSEWLNMWECKLDQPKILWTYQWLHFTSTNPTDEKDVAKPEDLAEWVALKGYGVDEDSYLEAIKEEKPRGDINFDQFWESLPKSA